MHVGFNAVQNRIFYNIDVKKQLKEKRKERIEEKCKKKSYNEKNYNKN